MLVPLHLIGSDRCEIFFSKFGGMVGMGGNTIIMK